MYKICFNKSGIISLNPSLQISYWKNGAVEDLDVGGFLIEKGKFRHGLFLLHLALEKALKAHVVKVTQSIPPKTHNLLRLAELASLELSEVNREYLQEFQQYNLEGRYPEISYPVIDAAEAKLRSEQAGDMVKWLITTL